MSLLYEGTCYCLLLGWCQKVLTLHAHTHTHTHIHTRTHIHKHTHAHTHTHTTHTRTHTYTHAHTHTHIHTYHTHTHTHTHTHIPHTHTHTRTHIYTHTTHTHTRTHTYIHTHMHTHTRARTHTHTQKNKIKDSMWEVKSSTSRSVVTTEHGSCRYTGMVIWFSFGHLGHWYIVGFVKYFVQCYVFYQSPPGRRPNQKYPAQLPVSPDWFSLALLFGSNGNSFTVSKQSDVSTYPHIRHNIEMLVGQKN